MAAGLHGLRGADLRPGEKVGEYEVQRLLGRGGMGAVYLAVQPQIGKRVAIKVLSQAVVNEENTIRFLREAQVVNKIGHPGLVDIFSFGQIAGGAHYLVMELLSGEPLTTRIAREAFGWGEVLTIFTQMLAALQAAHDSGIVHRDLKPDNVFLVGEGQDLKVKILDFGLAKVLDEGGDMTQTGIALGTPRYMAPEQSRGGRHVDHRVDIYAVGLMMYEAVTGRFPFEAPTALLMLTVKLSQDPPPPSQYAELPEELEAIILKALSKAPGARYQSAREMAEAMAALGGKDAQMVLSRGSVQRTVAMAPVTDLGLEAEATRVSRPDLPALDEGPGLPEEATRMSPGGGLRSIPSFGLEDEATRLSPSSVNIQTRAPRRTGTLLAFAAGIALFLGALSAILLRAVLRPPPPGAALEQPMVATPAAERPKRPPLPAVAPSLAPQGEHRPARPQAPRRGKRTGKPPTQAAPF